ncbi:MAG: AAA family ATPase, partial [Candidatus Altiarchaeota archaeon]|nr:AAA family ATPase [Candidatus Altiarchaeota archaeon]
MRILMLGVPGVGKSSVVNGVVEQGYELVNYGTIMFELAKRDGLVETRDE